MDIIWYLHWIFPISIIILPLLPNRFLIKILWYPLIYYIIWILFDGCPLNKYHNSDDSGNNVDEFLYPMIKKYFSRNISPKQFSRFIGLFLSLSIVLSSYKLLRDCKFKN